MYPRTPSPRKRGYRSDGGGSAAGGLPIPPPPLFQVPEGESNFDEQLYYSNDLKLYRKRSPSRHDWNQSVDHWEERYVPSPGASAFSPSAFYSPAPSMMTATTAPMTVTPTTEMDNTTSTSTSTTTTAINHSNSNSSSNNSFVPIAIVSPTNLTYCQPISPAPYLATPQPQTSRYHHATPTSSHHTPYYIINGNGTITPPGYTTPRRSPSKRYYWTPNSASSTGSPLPMMNLVEDNINPSRKQRLKTELCMHYAKGKECPFADKCTYAHGEEELLMTKVMDMQRAGLIEDAKSYRTKPCWTYVATGSCPFGKRCVAIHDPRITGHSSSWLPHTETQGNSMSTDINVDGLHQKRNHVIQHGNPFGEQFSMELDDFSDLYKLICNTTAKRRRNGISELTKLSIALQMRGEAGWMYKYRPQHMIRNTVCMVLQKRAFRLERSGEAIPISLNKYRAGTQRQILVRELAFGPDSDPSVRGVGLYFNICRDDIMEFTPQQAKRYRWIKKTPRSDDKPGNKLGFFDTRESFAMIRPFDKDAFDLATRILQHRYDTVKAEQLSALNQRFAVMKRLDKEKEDIRTAFRAQKKGWINWTWPVCFGREHVDEDTQVPTVDAEYIPIVDPDVMVHPNQSPNAVLGSSTQRLWESFIAQAHLFKAPAEPAEDGDDSSAEVKKNLMSSLEALAPRMDDPHRLTIFKRLASGYAVCQNRDLPHIKSNTKDRIENQILERASERCWKSLLLSQGDDELKQNEWKIVFEHFHRSKSKKTLDILQT